MVNLLFKLLPIALERDMTMNKVYDLETYVYETENTRDHS